MTLSKQFINQTEKEQTEVNINTCIFLDFLPVFFFERFAINPLDKIIEQRARGYFIAGSSPEVQRYEML